MSLTPDREQEVFGAISHPGRRRILDLLAGAEHRVRDIADHFRMSRPAVSQHLRILLDAGLVAEQRHGRERRYRLVPARLGPVRDWVAHTSGPAMTPGVRSPARKGTKNDGE